MDNESSLEEILKGVLYFYSETGTEGGYWAFQDSRYIQKKEGGAISWSYDGLHVLKNGDHVTIYSPDNNAEIWSGVINLKEHTLFTERASRFWIHADQIGVDRDVWAEYFFKEYPAQLISGKKQ